MNTHPENNYSRRRYEELLQVTRATMLEVVPCNLSTLFVESRVEPWLTAVYCLEGSLRDEESIRPMAACGFTHCSIATV